MTREGRVICDATIEIPMSAARAWGQLRDFTRYACTDPFHVDLRIEGSIPRAGAALTLYHSYVGIRIRRTGRILVWREGTQFSFSDLSLSGPRHGFPHVMTCCVNAVDDQHCAVNIKVQGRWSNRRIPGFLARLWLRWVFGQFQHGIENELLKYHLWQRSRPSFSPGIGSAGSEIPRNQE